MLSLRNKVRSFSRIFRYECTRSGSTLDLKMEDGIAVLTLQRPPVNSLNLELMSDIADALENVEKEKCKGAILTSGINSIFSAGMDIKEMYKPDVNRLKDLWKATRRVTSQLLNSSYVTACAITGHTSAAACILATLTEYRVMVDGKATISLNDTALDIVPPAWIVEIMKHTMGDRKAELALTASTLFSPQLALEEGLIDDIASTNEDAIEHCKKFIKKFDNIPPIARVRAKQLIRKSITDIWDEENKLERVEDYVKDVTSPNRQNSLELYMQAMKKSKK